MADQWRDVILETIRETQSKTKAGAGFGLWLVMKVKNEACYNVTVRAGSFYTDQVSGEKRLPKDGLTDWDFAALKKVWEEKKIAKLLDRKSPPPVPHPDAPPPAAAAEETIEDVPW